MVLNCRSIAWQYEQDFAERIDRQWTLLIIQFEKAASLRANRTGAGEFRRQKRRKFRTRRSVRRCEFAMYRFRGGIFLPLVQFNET